MLPITDLGTTLVQRNDGQGNYTLWDSKHRYRQQKPFNLNLPYHHYIGKTRFSIVGDGLGSQSWGADVYPPTWSPNYTETANRSYEKLRGSLYSSAGLGVNFVEFGQASSMISSAASTLMVAARHVRRGNFVSAMHTLKMKYLPARVSSSKSFASNWLEFHFGWVPLVHDIYDACDVVNNPVKSFHFEKGKASRVEDTSAILWDYYAWTIHTRVLARISSVQGARVKAITNAGLHSLEQFGLLNPASLAWEVVPFSFVVDWFVNVGDFLRSFSDFAGMSLDSTFHTDTVKAQAVGWYVHKAPYHVYAPRSWGIDYVETSRVTSLSGVDLEVKKLKLPSLSRAATAVSLVVQQLKR